MKADSLVPRQSDSKSFPGSQNAHQHEHEHDDDGDGET